MGRFVSISRAATSYELFKSETRSTAVGSGEDPSLGRCSSIRCSRGQVSSSLPANLSRRARRPSKNRWDEIASLAAAPCSSAEGAREAHWKTTRANPTQSHQCEGQDSNLHALRTLEPERTQSTPLSANSLGKDASADVLRGSEKTHSGQDVPDASDVVTMSDVRACARALAQRVAEGGEIPMASLRELGDLVLRSELVVVSHQLLEGPPEFALRRAMEVAGLVLASVAHDRGLEEDDEATK